MEFLPRPVFIVMFRFCAVLGITAIDSFELIAIRWSSLRPV